VLLCARRDVAAARRFFTRALRMLKVIASEVSLTLRRSTPACSPSWFPRRGTMSSSTPIIGEKRGQGRLKRRLRPMRGLQEDRTAQVVIAGHAFLRNLRRCHDELGVDTRTALRVAGAFTELAPAI